MIFASLGLDWANFQRGIQGAMASTRQLGSTMQQSSGEGMFGGLTSAISNLSAMAAAMKVATFAADGLMQAIQLGDDLVDLNAQTGVAVDKLMELQMAFELNGMKAEQVQPVLAKMQKLIAEAGSGSAEAAAKFAAMGISIDEIQGLTADEQLMKIGEAIKRIENPAQRAAAAMEIFGKSGAKLLSVFGSGGKDDPGGMQEVRKMLGNQTALLLENAGVFGKASDLLGLAGNKLRGFFVGVASEVVPQLMTVIEKSASLDFSKAGQIFGQRMAIALEIVSQIASIFDGLADRMPQIGNGLVLAIDAITAAISPLLGVFNALVKIGALTGFEEDVKAKQDAARKANETPDASPTGMDIAKKAGTAMTGAPGMGDISSLQKIGGGASLLAGMQTNSPAYQSVKVQEEIRDYVIDLIETVKQGGQSYQISPNTGGGMVLTA